MRASPALLTAVVTVAAICSCEPEPQTAPRIRTNPDLVAATSCNALFDTFKTRLLRDLDDKVLAQAYASMEGGGLFGPYTVPLYIDEDVYSDVVQTPRGLSALLADDDALWVARPTGVQHIQFDDSGFVKSTFIPVHDDDTGVNMIGIARGPSDKLALVSTGFLSVAGAGPSRPVEDEGEQKPNDSGVVVIDFLEPDTLSVHREQRLVFTGSYGHAGPSDGGWTLVVAHRGRLPYFTTYPLNDDSPFGLGGLAASVERAQEANHVLVDTLTLADVLPQRGSTLTAAEWVPSTEADCQNVSSPDDSTGTTFSTVVSFSAFDAPVRVWHRLGEPAATVIGDDRVAFIERAQGPSWHLGTDLAPMTNVHTVNATGAVEPQSHRVAGWPTRHAPVVLASSRAAFLLTAATRSPLTYDWSNLSLASTALDNAQSPTTIPLLHPLQSALAISATRNEVVVALESGTSVRVGERDSTLSLDGAHDGVVRFAHRTDDGAFVTVVSGAQQTLSVMVKRSNGTRIEPLHLIAAPDGVDANDEGARFAPSYYENPQSGGADIRYEEALGLLFVPLQSFRFDEITGVASSDTRLAVVAANNDELLHIGDIRHTLASTFGQEDHPIVDFALVGGDRLVAASYRMVTLHDLAPFASVATVEFVTP